MNLGFSTEKVNSNVQIFVDAMVVDVVWIPCQWFRVLVFLVVCIKNYDAM